MREYPRTHELMFHNYAEPDDGLPPAIAYRRWTSSKRLARWMYRIGYRVPGAAQDRLSLRIDINSAPCRQGIIGFAAPVDKAAIVLPRRISYAAVVFRLVTK